MNTSRFLGSLGNLPIRRKLMAILMLTSGLTLLLACVATVVYDRMESRREMVQRLTSVADVIGKNSAAALAFQDPQAAQEILAGLQEQSGILFGCIYTPNGQVFAEYGHGEPNEAFRTFLPEDRSYFTGDRLILLHRIVLEGETIGAVYLRSDLSELQSRLNRYTSIVGIILLLSSFLAFGLASKLQRLISEPILELVRTAKTVSVAKDYSIRAVHRTNDEMGLLIDGFNEMLAQIQSRDEKMEHTISERTSALKASEERLRLILDSTAEAIYGLDLEGNCTFCNPSCLRTLGYEKPEDLMGKNMHLLIHHSRSDGRSYPVEECPINQAFLQGRQSHVDNEVVWRADGGSLPVEYWSYPIRHENEILGSVVTFVDITERKRVEREKEQLSSILEATSDYVSSADLAGKILYLNRGGRRMLGYTDSEDLADKKIVDVHPAWAAQLVLNEGFSTAVREGTWRGETALLSRDGIEIPVSQVLLSHKSPDGTVRFFSTIMRDITERKQTEEVLRQAKEAAEAANRAKSDFLANMSHEIRTPMNAIVGMTELTLDSELSPEQRENLTLVKSATDSLLSLINDILDFSKIEAGKLEMDRVEFPLREALEGTMRTLAMRAHEKGLELACRVAPGLPEYLSGDPSRLGQIVINLVGNAIKFTPRGEVVLAVEEESHGENEICLHFQVRDTGIGIPAEKQQAVFEAFTQADTSTTRKYGGTGLGLSIASRLVAMMGGRLWLESEVGKGTTFHFTANFGRSRTLPEKPAPVSAAELAGLPVLVVDDNATNRHILDETLSRWEMLPTSVEGGPQALAALLKATENGEPFPLIILDMEMPGMDGFAVVERIRQNPAWNAATIMMLSSTTRPGDIVRCRELGLAAHLTKPIRSSELLEAVIASLGKCRNPEAREEGRESRINVISPAISRTPKQGGRSARILLVEDNPINQVVAQRLLEKQGYRVTVAGNGREALKALEATSYRGFDVVLMDVQMPEMDGLAATAAIREKEKGSDRHLPIVAMTAHAIQGDRERFISAGMDSYISKPFQAQDLVEAIERFARVSKESQGALRDLAAEAAARRAKAVLDELEDGSGLRREIANLFRENSPRQLSAIRQAIARGDGASLERAAHSLKGSVLHFSAPQAVQAAQRLETMGREGDLRRAEETFRLLDEQIALLECSLADLGKECVS